MSLRYGKLVIPAMGARITGFARCREFMWGGLICIIIRHFI